MNKALNWYKSSFIFEKRKEFYIFHLPEEIIRFIYTLTAMETMATSLVIPRSVFLYKYCHQIIKDASTQYCVLIFFVI
jgi:ribosomal protein S2